MTAAQVIKVLTDHPLNHLGWVCDNNMFVDFQKYSVRYDHPNEFMYLKPISSDKHSKDYLEPVTGTRYFKGNIVPYSTIQNAAVNLTDIQWLTF